METPPWQTSCWWCVEFFHHLFSIMITCICIDGERRVEVEAVKKQWNIEQRQSVFVGVFFPFRIQCQSKIEALLVENSIFSKRVKHEHAYTRLCILFFGNVFGKVLLSIIELGKIKGNRISFECYCNGCVARCFKGVSFRSWNVFYEIPVANNEEGK